MLKPTRWKVVFSLFPFIFPSFQTWLLVQMTFNLYVDINNILFDIEEIIDAILFTGENFIAIPFEPLLQSLGWWSSNGIFVAPNGPLLPGSFLIAITYSVLTYIAISFLSSAWKKQFIS